MLPLFVEAFFEKCKKTTLVELPNSTMKPPLMSTVFTGYPLILLQIFFYNLIIINMKKIALLIVLVLAFKANAQNMLYGPANNSRLARGISSNGRYVTGQSANVPREAFTWDITSGNDIVLAGNSLSEGYNITNNNRLVGSFADPELLVEDAPIRSGGFWENGSWKGLGLGVLAGAPPVSTGSGSHAACITEDGNTIAGFCTTYNYDPETEAAISVIQPYSWTYNETAQTWDGELWASPDNIQQGSAIVSISGDGKVATGWTNLEGASGRKGILWTSKNTFKLFDYGEYADNSEYVCLSKNGRYAGFRHKGISGIYDIEEDEYTIIPQGLMVSAISDNGMVAGVYRNAYLRDKAFVWSQALGFVDFGDFVSVYAPDIVFPTALQTAFNFTTVYPYAVSTITPDGQSFVITSGTQAYVLKFEQPFVIAPYPENVSATVSRAERNKVTITWNAPEEWVEPLKHYIIYRDNEPIDTVDAGTLTCIDNNVYAGYVNYAVQAIYKNEVSKKTEPVEAIIVDSYQIPFFEGFESRSFKTNYWTFINDHSIWNVVSGAGVEARSAGATVGIGGERHEPFSTVLISKPLDATTAANVYLSYMVLAHYTPSEDLTSDTLLIDISEDGNNWINVDKYVFPELIDWKAEILDLSHVAAGKLVNIRFRIEGITHSLNIKRYFFDNISVSVMLPAGEAVPLKITGLGRETTVDLAWQNPDGIYGLGHQQTPLRSAFGNEGKNFIAAQNFEAEQLAVYKKLYLVSISSYIRQEVQTPAVPTVLKLAVFVDDKRIVSQAVTEFTPNSWNTFALNTPLLLDSVKGNLKIGIEVVSHDVNEVPIGGDEMGRAVAGKGDLFSVNGGGTWALLSAESDKTFHRNWCIIGNVSTSDKANIKRTPDVLGYNVYRDGVKINDYLIFGQSLTTEKGEESCYTVRAFSLTSGISEESNPYCEGDDTGTDDGDDGDDGDGDDNGDGDDVSIANYDSEDAVIIYPNPVSTFLHVKIGNRETADYAVYNTVGQVVLRGKLEHHNTAINVQSLSKGFYYLQVEGRTMKVVKE